MADSLASQQPKESANSTTTTTLTLDSTDSRQQGTVHLKLKKPQTERKVQWTTETVDNEEMDKKKSKCCCIYKKPTQFGESSSEESDDEDDCHGHVEKKKKKKKGHQNDACMMHSHDSPSAEVENPDSTDPLIPESSGSSGT